MVVQIDAIARAAAAGGHEARAERYKRMLLLAVVAAEACWLGSLAWAAYWMVS